MSLFRKGFRFVGFRNETIKQSCRAHSDRKKKSRRVAAKGAWSSSLYSDDKIAYHFIRGIRDATRCGPIENRGGVLSFLNSLVIRCTVFLNYSGRFTSIIESMF